MNAARDEYKKKTTLCISLNDSNTNPPQRASVAIASYENLKRVLTMIPFLNLECEAEWLLLCIHVFIQAH